MLSQTVEYALRAMTHLATLSQDNSLNSEGIAKRTKVPKGYLSKILRDLVIAELITSQRGPNGGFTLAKPASEISILDVVNAVDPIERITKCPLGNPAHLKLCPLHQHIDDSIAKMEKSFGCTMLPELLETSNRGGPQCKTLTVATIGATNATSKS